jgi:membrane protease YdiL (CAAX protease family)
MTETNQLPRDDKINEHYRDNGSSGKKWWILALLSLSIVISHAPIFIGCLVFVEGDFIEEKNFVLLELLRILSMILMVASAVGMWRFTIIPRIFMQWLGKKKNSTILGVIALPVILIMTDVILLSIFDKLGIYVNYGVARTKSSDEIALFLVHVILPVVAIPIVEEIFWRGYVQGVLERTTSRPIAVFGQAFLFALIHMVGIAGRFRVFVLGLILGFWRCRRRTLIPLIVAHIVFNSLFFARILYNYFEEGMVKVTHDYRTPLENLCRPVDYLPENNALPYYVRAIESLVEPPDEFGEDLMKWPDDLSDEEAVLLRSWISANHPAINEFEIASQKPYCFREYSKESIGKRYALPIEGSVLMHIIMLSRAQISAAQGDFQASVSDILTCYRFGQHFAAPKPLVEQLMGLEVKDEALRVAFFILGKSEPADIYLKELQLGLTAISEREKIPIDFTLERLFFHDVIQRNFTNDGTGNGRIPRAFFDDRGKPDPILRYLGCSTTDKDQIRRWRNLDRRQTARITDDVFSRLAFIKNYTPAQLHRKDMSVREIIRQSAQDNVFVLAMTKTFEGDYHYAYRLLAEKDALIVTAAIMRYRLAQGDLPDELEQLIRADYLDSLPLDPYSDAPFVYRKSVSDFLLYSLGRDFDDDGGIRSSSENNVGGDDVFWPLEDN